MLPKVVKTVASFQEDLRKKICDTAMDLQIVKHLEQNNVTCFPVLFSTWPGDIAGEVKVGVLYNEAAMYEFTKSSVLFERRYLQ